MVDKVGQVLINKQKLPHAVFLCPISSISGVQVHGPVSFSVSFPKQAGCVLNQYTPRGTVSVPAVPSGREPI